MSSRKRFTPDPGMANKLSALVAQVEINLMAARQHGLKAEKLDYCVCRTAEIQRKLNEAELGSFFGIAVKRTCDELWKNLP